MLTLNLRAHDSLTSIFQLATTSAILCSDCGHESKTAPLFERTLSLGLMPKTRGGSISSYLEQEMVDVVDGYRCESCNKSGKRSRVREVEHGPDVLVVQLKRYTWDGRKDSQPIETGTRLDLNQFRGALGDEENLLYEPIAVVNHAGSTGSGHYTCSAKGPDGAWHCYDDSLKSRMRVETLSQASKMSYLVFYKRKAD